MNFQELLKQQVAQQYKGDRAEVDYPSSHLKHKELFIPKETNNVLVRILPPVVSGEDYNKMTREVFLQTRNKNGKELKLNAVLSPYVNYEDSLDKELVKWNAENRVPNRWNKNTTPTRRYLTNVVQLVKNPQTGQYSYETDENGNIMVRLFKLPHSACQLINAKLMDSMLSPKFKEDVPESVTQYSFISSADAFPIMISKPSKNSGQMSYDVQVYSNMPLGELPQGWENQLEDLAYQATPSYEYNREYVDYFIDVVNGVEGAGQATQPTQPTQSTMPQQANQGFNMQQPVQPMQLFNQPGQPMQTFSQPVQPMQTQNQPVQPMQTFNQPESTVSQPSVLDSDLPFNMQDMPNVSPEPTNNVVPPTDVPESLPDINDLLQQMKLS